MSDGKNLRAGLRKSGDEPGLYQISNGLGDVVDLLPADSCEHRERDEVVSAILANRKGSPLIAEMLISLLKMNRLGVVQPVSDSSTIEELNQTVPVRRLNRINVIDMPVTPFVDRSDDRWDLGERLVVLGRVMTALRIVQIQLLELQA